MSSSLTSFVILILCRGISAQPGGGSRSDPYMTGRVTPSMAIIIIVLITAVFFMAFFSIYIRHCSGENSGGSMRAMVAAVAGRSRRNRGLEPDKLDALPTFAYSEVKGLKIGKGALECAVCLNEFEDSETLRFIPRCDHVFHADCIDVWLGSHTTCPVCRADLGSEPDPDLNPAQLSQSGPTLPDPDETRVDPPSPDSEIRPVRSRSMFVRLPKSHSTGHSLVQPGEDCDRFTLRLPDEVRSRLVNRGLDRASSLVVLSRESSSRTGYRTGAEVRSYRRLERFEPRVKSDRWVFSMAPRFFTRTGSFKSQKGPADGTLLSAVKDCLSPKGADSRPSDASPLPV